MDYMKRQSFKHIPERSLFCPCCTKGSKRKLKSMWRRIARRTVKFSDKFNLEKIEENT